MAKTEQPVVERAYLSLKEGTVYAGLCESFLRKLNKTGRLPFVRLDDRTLIRKTDLDALFNGLTDYTIDS